MADDDEEVVIGRAFSDGTGVVITGPDQVQRLRRHRLGGGAVPESDPRLPKDYAVSAILTCEEANFALDRKWLKMSSPSTPVRRPLFQRVFEDLWEKGLWITSGMKFGADMLVYQEAPGTVHSSYIVLVRESDQPLDVLDLVTVGRLATAVNKKVVIADVDKECCVRYTTLEWDQIASNPYRKSLSLAELDEAIDTI